MHHSSSLVAVHLTSHVYWCTAIPKSNRPMIELHLCFSCCQKGLYTLQVLVCTSAVSTVRLCVFFAVMVLNM